MNTNEIYELLKTFRDWLQCLEAHQDSEDTFWSVLDPLEITAVGIISAYMCLKQTPADNPVVQVSRETQLLAISLLSYLSGRFSDAASMRRILSALFNEQSMNRALSGDVRLPRKLREMLHRFTVRSAAP